MTEEFKIDTVSIILSEMLKESRKSNISNADFLQLSDKYAERIVKLFVIPVVCESTDDWKKPLIDRVKYDLRRYTELTKRMNELIHVCESEADFSGKKEAEIKRNCYNKFVNDLNLLVG